MQARCLLGLPHADSVSSVVFAVWCGPCQQIAPVYEALSKSLSRPQLLTFVKIDTEKVKALSEEYQITALPTFLLFQEGKVIQSVKGANPTELRRIIQKLASELESAGESSGTGTGSSGPWAGAEIPRGYSDISDQVEIRNCELSNADEDAGPVKVLFDVAKPSALSNDSTSVNVKDFVQSGADDQLLLFIPFQGSVKLHTLQVGQDVYHSFPAVKLTGARRLRLFLPRTKIPSRDP